MRCKYCNIEIIGGGVVCPLCHEKLDEADRQPILSFPPKNFHPTKTDSRFNFKSIYIFLSISLFLLALALSLIFTPQVQWFWLIGLTSLYVYVCIYNTILSSNSISVKIILQAIFVFLIIFASQAIFKNTLHKDLSPTWLMDYAFSGTICLSLVSIAVYTAIKVKRDYSLIIDINFISLTGFIPIILYATGNIAKPIIAIVCCIISSLIILGSIAFGHKELTQEFKKKFHF